MHLMSKSPAERAEISRQNGRRNTGHKSTTAKEHSKFNALKHGLHAKLPVLPGEDPQHYQDRLDAWSAAWQPANDLESTLVERAVTLSWQLDRAARAEAARLTTLLRTAPDHEALRQQDEAAALGQRLLFDRCGPVPLYPHALYHFPDRPRVSGSGQGDDPDDPARLLPRLEATAAGCQWLLDRWAELGSLLDRQLTWQSPDKLKAIRLLGRQPLDAADCEVVATLFQACHVLDPQVRHQAHVAPEEALRLAEAVRALKAREQDDGDPLPDALDSVDDAEPQPDPDPLWNLDGVDPQAVAGELDEAEEAEALVAWQRCGPAFSELLGELTPEEGDEYHRRLEARRVDRLRPRSKAAARAALRAIVEKAVTRLEAKREVHQARETREAAQAVDRFCFDASAEGEQLRRFQLAGQRALLRTVDALLKLRREPHLGQTGHDAAEPAATAALGESLSATITCSPEGLCSSLCTEVLPAVPDPPASPPAAPVPEHDEKNLRNEPSDGSGDRPVAAEESTAVVRDAQISRNEPGNPAGEPAVVAVEAAIAGEEPSPQPQPECLRSGVREPGESTQALSAGQEAGTDPALPPARSAPGEDSLTLAPRRPSPVGPGPERVYEKPW
jgi:hypothetical protein